MAYANVPIWIRETLRHLKTQEMCNKAIEEEPCSWVFIPNRFKTQGMLNEAVRREPYTLLYVPDDFITQEMCEEAMPVGPAVFFLIPDRLQTQEMCIKAVEVHPWHLGHITSITLKHKKCVIIQCGISSSPCSLSLIGL